MTRSRLRILVVEDHSATGQALTRMLRPRHQLVLFAGNADQALAIAWKEPMDLLITDLGLPDINGWDLFRLLHNIQPDLRAIAVSGYGGSEDQAHSAQFGFDAHLVKPVTSVQIEAAIQKLFPEGHGVQQPPATEEPTLRLLHLEDDLADVALTRFYGAEDCGQCEITAVASREQFLQALEQGPFDGIISDSSVFNMTGAEALQLARARLPNVPFVFLCGMLSEQRRAELLSAQPHGLFAKDERVQIQGAFRMLANLSAQRRQQSAN